MACLFPQAWGWRSEKSSKLEQAEDDELLPQGATIAPLPSLLSFSLNPDCVACTPPSSSADAFSDDLLALGLGDRMSNRDIIELAPSLRSCMLAFDRKVQLLREVAAKLTLAVQACSLHRHLADMSTLIQEVASSSDESNNIDICTSVVHLAQALQDSAAAESQSSVLLQDMLFQIDNMLKFDVARAVALIISLEEAREALLSAMSKTRVRSSRPGPDEGRRRLQAEECLAARQTQYDRLTESLAACVPDLSLRIDLVLAKALSTYVKVRGDAAASTNRSLIGCDMDVHKIDTCALNTVHASAAYHLLQDIPRPISLNSVVPQLLACPGYGFANVLLEVSSDAAQSIEADAIPQCTLSLLDDLGFATDFIRITVLSECARASTRGAAPPFRSASNANRILVCAMQLGCGQYFMHTLSPLFTAIMMENGGVGMANILTLSSSTSSSRGGGSTDNALAVVAALDEVLNSIIGSITHVPMWLRCICQHVFSVTCTSDDRGRSRYACGGVMLLCGFCPAISNPEKFGLIPASTSVTEPARQILRGLSRALTILANGYDVNSVDDGFMSLIRPSLEAAMPQYLSFLDQLMCSQHPAQVSSLLPPIKVWRSQREDVSIVLRFADRHSHRLRKSLAMRGHRRELLVLRHLLRAPRETLPTLDPSPVFLAARPSMSNSGAMQWASSQLVQPRSSTIPPRSRRSVIIHGAPSQPTAPLSSSPSNPASSLQMSSVSAGSRRSMIDATAYSASNVNDEVGVGIEVEVSTNGRVTVRRLENGGPAQRCGFIEVGDEIVSIDGQEISSVPNPMSISARYLYGSRGSQVSIMLRRRGNAHTHSVILLRNASYKLQNLDSAPTEDSSADASFSSNYGQDSMQFASKSHAPTSPKSLRFADGTATSDGHGGAPKRLRTCGVSFIKSSGVYLVKRFRAGVSVPESLKPGMQLIQVDGIAVLDLSEVEVLQLLLGPEGSMCSLMLQNPQSLSETVTVSLPRSYRGGSKDGTDASEDSDTPSTPSKSSTPALSSGSIVPLSTALEQKSSASSSGGGLKSVYENLSMSLIGAATGRAPSSRGGVQQVGIGVSFVPAPDSSGFVISKILPGSAASRSALAAGDYVVTIDGNSVGGINLNELRALITGDVDSVATIGYRQQGSGPIKHVKIKRATLDPLVMAAMSSQQSFTSVQPAVMRSRSPQAAVEAAVQSQSPLSESSAVSSETLPSGADNSTAASATFLLGSKEESDSTVSNSADDLLSASGSCTSSAAVQQQIDADGDMKVNKGTSDQSGTGASTETDGDCSDDDYGAAPLLQSPSKELYLNHQKHHIERLQNIESTRLEQSNYIEPQIPAQPASSQQPQRQDCNEDLDLVIPIESIDHQLLTQHNESFHEEEPIMQQSLPDNQNSQVPKIQSENQHQNRHDQLKHHLEIESQSVISQFDEEGTASKFVFIASFGLTLCEDGRGYWYISAKVGDNRLPSLFIGDVIRTISDTTARGWGADRLFSALDKGGVEIGIQRGLTAAMRFVTLPIAENAGNPVSASLVARHGLGFAFKRNDNSGALVVTSLRDGSAASACRCLEVGDILLEVDGVHVVGLPARVVRDMLMGPEGSPAVIGVRPANSGTSLAAALSQRKPLATASLTIAETDFGAVLRIQLVRQRLPTLTPSMVENQDMSGDKGHVSVMAGPDGDASDCSIGGGRSGDYGLGISFSPGARLGAVTGEDNSSSLRFYVLRLVAGGPAEMCGLIQPGDELVSVDGVTVAGFSFARVRSAVVGAMGSVVELQLLRASDGVSRRVFVPRCYPVGASSSGWSSMDSERSDGESGVVCAPRPLGAPALESPQSSGAVGSDLFGIGCTFRRDSRGRYRVKRVIKGGAAHAAHAVLSGDFVLQVDGVAAAALSEAEFLQIMGGREGSVCVLQLDRDDGGGQSHVVDVSVCRAGLMDEEQMQIPSTFTGQDPIDSSGRQSPSSLLSERSVGSFDVLKDGHSKITLSQRCWYMLGLQLAKDNHKNVLIKSIRPESPAAQCNSRVIRVGDCVRYVNGKPVNGRPVDEVLKDIVGEEGQAVEVSLRAADEAKSQVVRLIRAPIPGISGSNSSNSSNSNRGKSVGVGISFVRRTGTGGDVSDSKFFVKRLVQGSDTAMQGDVEVGDVVVRVDGHPVKGWDEKALLAHVMGEEGTYCNIEFDREGVGRIMVDLLRQSSQSMAK